MIKLILTISLIFFLAKGEGQIKEFVKNNAVKIRSIAPDSTDYSDLDKIGEAIGNARIVMLGEQDHGDAPTFLAKTRLIRYLHEKKGFNVLAFESDFFGLNQGIDQLSKTRPAIDSFLRMNIFGIWTGCDACNNLLYNYIPDSYLSTNPLKVSGFDNQQILKYSGTHLKNQIDSFCRQLALPIILLPEYNQEVLPIVDIISKSYSLPKDSISFNKRSYYLNLLKEQLVNKTDQNNFWVLVVDNLIAANIQFTKRSSNYYESMNARDIQMAANLKWLKQNKFSSDKIIVWAHNYHVSKYNGHFNESFLNKNITMGSAFTSDSEIQRETYVIGFTSYEGKAGRITQKEFTIQKPQKNSIEKWFNEKWAYAFIDFKSYPNISAIEQDLFSMKGSIKGTHINHEAYWNKIFDGVFFIREMYPCKK